jgi:site-specific recombinase XerD
VYLSHDEVVKLLKICRMKLFDANLQAVLKLFLFACMTGIRISDIFTVHHDNIYNGVLIFLPKKSKNTKSVKVEVPLTSVALEMVGRRDGLLFDRVSQQHVNRSLKKIMEYSGIKKSVTFHTARHTFATLFLETGGSVEVLQILLGHTSIMHTMVYVHVGRDRISDQVGVFNSSFL